jgi:RNA polymerase sigma-70 factor (ECF subfamily)
VECQIIQSALIDAAVGGDRLALSQLLFLHHHGLSRHIARQVSAATAQQVSVEDVVQETYLRAFRDIRSCAARDDRSFAAWLAAIGSHQLQNALKAARAQKRGGERTRVGRSRGSNSSSLDDIVAQLSDHGESPSHAVARHEAAAALQISLASLPADQRIAVQLRYLDGQTEEEAAASMGRTRGAVHGLVVRARVRMREMLGRSSRWFSRGR